MPQRTPRKRKNSFLPDNVTRYKDRHGKWRYRFRKVGAEGGTFRAEIGTEAWNAELAAFQAGIAAPAANPRRYAPGTVGDLVTRYCAVPSRLGPTEITQAKVRAVLERFRDDHADKPVQMLGFEHVDRIVAKRREKAWNAQRKRWEGGIDAAKKLRKELVRLFDFAIKVKMVRENVVRQADRVKVAPAERSKGFHTWTEGDITAYRAKHKLGTRPRLAMELMLWTGQRRSDAREFGPADIVDGLIAVDQGKTGKSGVIAVAPQLVEAITAMPPLPEGATTFLVTKFGKPFSRAGFGNAMRDWCDEAGLPACTAHGLRKAIMRRMAELDMGNQTMKSISLHSKDDEVARYTASANQKRMAGEAIARLSSWEMSNRASGLDVSPSQTPENVEEK